MKCKCLLLSLVFCACTNGNVDEEKLNEAGEQLLNTVQDGIDTVGSKLKKFGEKIDSTFDSTYHNDTSSN